MGKILMDLRKHFRAKPPESYTELLKRKPQNVEWSNAIYHCSMGTHTTMPIEFKYTMDMPKSAWQDQQIRLDQFVMTYKIAGTDTSLSQQERILPSRTAGKMFSPRGGRGTSTGRGGKAAGTSRRDDSLTRQPPQMGARPRDQSRGRARGRGTDRGRGGYQADRSRSRLDDKKPKLSGPTMADIEREEEDIPTD